MPDPLLSESPDRSTPHSARATTEGAWLFWLLCALLIFAPLIRGGNRPLPLLVLELGALALLLGMTLRPRFTLRLPTTLWLGLAAMVSLPLLQLLPLPAGWLEFFPGRQFIAETQATLGLRNAGWASWSLVPILTESAWLALLPPLAVFLAVSCLHWRDVERLTLLLLGIASIQAILGLIQFGSGGEVLAALGIGTGGRSGEGTYANRNHLAGLLEMVLPIALALLAASVFGLDRAARPRHRRHISWRQRFGSFAAAESQTNRTLLYVALCLVILLGLIFSRSRAGVALGMIGLVLTAVLLARNFGQQFSRQVVGAITAAGFVLAATIGLTPVLMRFTVDSMADVRWSIFNASWQAARDFFPFGTGAGTYVDVIRAYHPDAVSGDVYINHAHSDYLEWAVEGGALALVAMALFLFAYSQRWPAIWRVRNWHQGHMMQVGAGTGLALLLGHGFVDYNLRIPANQIYFVLLAAIFFHPGRDSKQTRHRPSHTQAVLDALPPEPEPATMPMHASTARANQAVADAWGLSPSTPNEDAHRDR